MLTASAPPFEYFVCVGTVSLIVVPVCILVAVLLRRDGSGRRH